MSNRFLVAKAVVGMYRIVFYRFLVLEVVVGAFKEEKAFSGHCEKSR